MPQPNFARSTEVQNMENPMSPFESGFVSAVYVISSISNRDANVNAKEFVLAVNRVEAKTGRD
jgi:hypothetical protein